MTPSSTPCERGDIVFVRVRFSDDSGAKRRPALVVSVGEVHEARADALIMPLTTRVDTIRFGDCLLSDWRQAGVPRPSLVKGVIETVARSTFESIAGHVPDSELAKVEERLRAILGL